MVSLRGNGSSIAQARMLGLALMASLAPARAQFTHPGCLSSQTDLNRMATKVSANAQPWKGSWDILVTNTNGFLGSTPEAVATIYAGNASQPENFMRLARDGARAYQLALRYHGSGTTIYADKAIGILNSWAATHTGWEGDSNVGLRAGIYGYQFACAGELLRNYSGWQAADFAAFQTYMVDRFYGVNNSFLTGHYGTVPGHYWSNWDLSTMASIMAIGVLCDNQTIFDQGLNYFYSGVGNGAITNAVTHVHPNGMGQWQESGRDQGHSVMGPQVMGAICEIAWNQGIDLYGYLDNRLLAGVEYVSKYNLWEDVPYVAYVWRNGQLASPVDQVQPVISSVGRGAVRPGWDLLYNHYVNRKGGAAPYIGRYAEATRPEGGGFNYGPNSGGFDSLGFTTLTHSLDPIAAGAAPSALVACVEGRQITLSWAGSTYAASYNVKRSTSSGGPYATLGVVGGNCLHYVDAGLTSGTTYYYVVSANAPGGESANSTEKAATCDGQMHGTVIGTAGSFNNSGAEGSLVFDGSVRNYFDAPTGSGSWAGIDLGDGASAVITG
ncbi:MAG: alginate lyase family protein, partial [Verrucomicrobiae bacterium]|nr:alginate lyase family protein [Verrucomicrobiae bacterium]